MEKYSLQGKDAPGKDNGLILVGPVDSTVLDAFRTDFSGALAHFGFPPCPGNIMMRNPGPWTYHVHLMEPSYPRWDALLVFRDYLRAHPEAARAYANIKRALAASSKDDIEAYPTGKHTFVQETTAKARAWRADAGDQ